MYVLSFPPTHKHTVLDAFLFRLNMRDWKHLSVARNNTDRYSSVSVYPNCYFPFSQQRALHVSGYFRVSANNLCWASKVIWLHVIAVRKLHGKNFELPGFLEMVIMEMRRLLGVLLQMVIIGVCWRGVPWNRGTCVLPISWKYLVHQFKCFI